MPMCAEPVSAGASNRSKLKAAAICGFREHGYHGLSVRDITGSLGLTSAALYAFFPSKEALLRELILDGHAEIERLMGAAAAIGRYDPQTDLTAHVYVLGVFYTEHIDLAVVGRQAKYLGEEAYQDVLQRRRRIRNVFEEIVADGQRQGVFAERMVRVVTSLMLRMTQSLSDFYKPGGPMDSRELAVLNAELAFQMLAIPPYTIARNDLRRQLDEAIDAKPDW